MEVLGIVISVALAFVGIYLTNRGTAKIGKETAESITKIAGEMIKAERENGVKCIEKDLQQLAEDTQKGIKAIVEAMLVNGEQVRKSIEADGKQTREAIVALQEGKQPKT